MNKKVQIMQNESETEFHRVYKVSPTQQLTKLTHLLRESGAVEVTGSMVGSVVFFFFFLLDHLWMWSEWSGHSRRMLTPGVNSDGFQFPAMKHSLSYGRWEFLHPQSVSPVSDELWRISGGRQWLTTGTPPQTKMTEVIKSLHVRK